MENKTIIDNAVVEVLKEIVAWAARHNNLPLGRHVLEVLELDLQRQSAPHTQPFDWAIKTLAPMGREELAGRPEAFRELGEILEVLPGIDRQAFWNVWENPDMDC